MKIGYLTKMFGVRYKSLFIIIVLQTFISAIPTEEEFGKYHFKYLIKFENILIAEIS